MYKGFVGMKKEQKKEFNKTAVKIFARFNKLGVEFGDSQVRFAMRRYLTQFSEENKRKVQISQLERELEQLKRKRL